MNPYEEAIEYGEEMSDMWFEAEERLDSAMQKISRYRDAIAIIDRMVKDHDTAVAKSVKQAISDLRKQLKGLR